MPHSTVRNMALTAPGTVARKPSNFAAVQAPARGNTSPPGRAVRATACNNSRSWPVRMLEAPGIRNDRGDDPGPRLPRTGSRRPEPRVLTRPHYHDPDATGDRQLLRANEEL